MRVLTHSSPCTLSTSPYTNPLCLCAPCDIRTPSSRAWPGRPGWRSKRSSGSTVAAARTCSSSRSDPSIAQQLPTPRLPPHPLPAAQSSFVSAAHTVQTALPSYATCPRSPRRPCRCCCSALPTRLYSSLFKEQPFPHLTIFKPSPLPPPAPIDAPSSSPTPSLPPPTPGPPPSPLDLSSPPSPITFYGPRALGSEVWTVDRCSVEQSYLVAYYGDGDAFYSDVYPLNWSGAYDCIRLRAKRWATRM